MSRTNVILFGVVIALGAFIAFFERGTLSTGEREGRKGQVLDSFVRDKVQRIELQRKGITIVLVRRAADPNDQFDVPGWSVDEPYKARADHVVVDNLLGGLEYFEPRRTLGPLSEAERERFGLSKPRYRLAFTIGRDRVSFRVGSPAADGGAYLELAGKGGYVVGKELVELLDHDPSDYHAKELHEGVSVHSMQQLSLRDASGERKIEKHAGFYWMTAPFTGLVNEPNLRGVVDGFDGLKASRYVAEAAGDLSRYGLAAPRFELQLNSRVFDPKAKVKGEAHEEKLELRLGAACDGHAGETYLRVNAGPVFCGLDADLDKLKKSADELRERRALPLEDGDIHGAQIVAGESELILAESGNDTLFRRLEHGREVEKGVVDQAALHDWYKQLRELSAARFLPPSAASAKPIATLTFKQGKDQPDYVLRLFAGSATETLASRLDDPAVLQLPAAARELVSSSPLRFRKRSVSDEDETKFSRVTIHHPNAVDETVRKNADGRFELSGPITGLADRARVDDLVHALSKLEALRFVSEAALPEQGLTSPHALLEIEYAQAGKTMSHRLELGAINPDGRFARFDGDPAVFLIAPVVADKLEGPLLDRAALALPLAEINAFELSSAKSSLRIEKRPDGFEIIGAEADHARAAQLARSLGALVASRVVAYGKPEPSAGFDKPQLRALIKLSDGRSLSLLFGRDREAGVWVRRSDIDATFALPRASLDALLERDKPAG